MAGVNLSKKVFVQCLIKAFEKSFNRSLNNLREKIPYLKFVNKKIVKHAIGLTVFTIIIIGMALPESLAANDTQMNDVQPYVALANENLESSLEEFNVPGMYMEDTTAKNQEAATEITQLALESNIGNNEYPYAKKAEQGVTLAIKLADSTKEATYQWQYSDDKNQWIDIDGKTEETFENASPMNERWYRCVVNGYASKPVQVIGQFKCAGESEKDSLGRIWTNPLMPWYISNGNIAYGINSTGTVFDVVGLYNKGGKTYMLQTAYSKGWSMVTSSSDAPALDYAAAQLDDLIFGFDSNDDFALYIDAYLASGQTGFSFGCDTMLGNDATSRMHSDFAALEVNKKSDNTIENIAMVGAGSSSQAAGSNPGFVITPITCGDLEFWLGHYNERQYFSYNEGTGNITVEGEYIENICTESQGIDAGMTMSWFNVPEGESVRFMFSVGDAASIGVTTNSGNINYVAELIEGLKENTIYDISVDGDETTYLVLSNALGHITFKGVDSNGIVYNFYGKNIHITKNGSEDKSIDVNISGL